MRRQVHGSRAATISAAVASGVSALLLATACGAGTTSSVDTASPPPTNATPHGRVVHGKKVDKLFYEKNGRRLGYPPCPNESNRTLCIYGQNTAQVFVGPNQLGPAAYPLQSASADHGYFVAGPANPFSPAWPPPGGYLAKLDSSGAGAEAELWYNAPGNLPPGDDIYLDAENPLTGSDDITCQGGTYTFMDCSTTGGDDANYSVQIGNYPLTVAIQNNLTNSVDALSVQGSPSYSGPYPDPNGGNPTTVGPGATGYFGMYMQEAPVQDSFAVKYALPADSPDLAGTTIGVEVLITNAGTLDKGSVCTVSLGSTTQSAYCDLSIIGGSGANTVTVNIHQ